MPAKPYATVADRPGATVPALILYGAPSEVGGTPSTSNVIPAVKVAASVDVPVSVKIPFVSSIAPVAPARSIASIERMPS